MNILVSVILPVYNGSKFLEPCIKSVIKQTYKNFELIVIDDGSIDNSKEIIERCYCDKIKCFFKKNEGVAKARNVGLKKAKGDIICFIDQDDMWDKDYLSFIVENMKNYDFIYTNGIYIKNDNYNNIIYNHKQTQLNKNSSNINRMLIQNFIVSPTQVSISRNVVLKVGMFDSSLNGSGADDWDYWIRVFKLNDIKILYIDIPLIKYRIHDFNNSLNRESMLQCKISVLNKHKMLIIKNIGNKYYKKNLAIIFLKLAFFKIKKRDILFSLKYFVNALYQDPFVLINKEVYLFIKNKI
jgi:glycosyltransferase involved in cell wall biosynthesis